MPRNTTRVIAHGRASASTPAQTSVGGTAGVILNANPLRTGLVIVNTGTTTIYLTLGGTSPTTTAYHVPLKAAAIADDGGGGVFIDDAWNGVVRAIGSAGGGSVVITEILLDD